MFFMEITLEGKFVLYEENRKLAWIEFKEKQDEIELISTFSEKEDCTSILIEKALFFAKNYKKIKISCPTIKSWIEKHGFDRNVEYTKLLTFKNAVMKFNMYRSPEATAEIVEVDGEYVLVKMTGPFCRSCGVFDYFEDISVEADAEVVSYDEVDDGFLVKYRLR